MGYKFLNLKLGGIILLPLFFFLTSFLAFDGLARFNSPDETANYFFAKNFATETKLAVEEKLNLESPIVHPRSVNVRGDKLVPGSFIGLILLYGSLAKVFGIWIITFLTPLFATLAMLAFYATVKKLFDQKVALISALLWSFHPAVLYYTARGLLPNMLFVSFLIFAAFFYIRSIDKEKIREKIFASVLAGASLGVALTVRANEIVWVGPLVIFLLAYNFGKMSWRPVLGVLLSLSFILLAVGYFHNEAFGSPFRTGYQQQLENAGGSSLNENKVFHENVLRAQSRSKSQYERFKAAIKPFILPFGINSRLARINSFDYLINIFWWLSIPAIWSLVWYLKNRQKIARREKLFIIGGLMIGLWLAIYYGSTNFRDSTLKGATIGTSYVRYWLPIYIWSIPLIAKAILLFGRFLGGLVLISMAILGMGITFFFTPESLVQIKNNIADYQLINERVLSLTEADSIIVTYRTDKIFFPERRIIHYLPPDYSFRGGIYRLMKKAPIYFFTMLPAKDIEYLNSSYFWPVGWKLTAYEKINNFDLYKVVPAERL